jgi:hypothetical protein
MLSWEHEVVPMGKINLPKNNTAHPAAVTGVAVMVAKIAIALARTMSRLANAVYASGGFALGVLMMMVAYDKDDFVIMVPGAFLVIFSATYVAMEVRSTRRSLRSDGSVSNKILN